MCILERAVSAPTQVCCLLSSEETHFLLNSDPWLVSVLSKLQHFPESPWLVKAITLLLFNLCLLQHTSDLSEQANILCMNECCSPPSGVLLIKIQ